VTIDVSIIIPTKAGRERVLGVTLGAIAASTPPEVEIIQPEEYATVGEAWNAGAERAKGGVLLFTTDDCVPHAGWYEAMLSTWGFQTEPHPDDVPLNEDSYVERVVAAPVLEYPHGDVEAYGSMGGGMKLPAGYDWMRVRSSGVLAMPRALWLEVGPFADLHYFVDDDWCWRAELAGIQIRVRDAFRMTHAHQPDRAVIAASHAHQRAFLERVCERRRVER